jgi:hypothetical protein
MGQLHDGATSGRLTTARFTDEAQCFAGFDVEAHTRDGEDLAVATRRKLDDEILDPQEDVVALTKMCFACTSH